MNKPWKVLLAFAGVFLAGVICGGPLAMRIHEHQEQNRPPFVERTMKRFDKELELTPTQKERILPIMLRAQKDWRQVRQDTVQNLTGVVDRMHEEIAAELRPEQRAKLEEMRQEFRARAERFRGRNGEHDRRRTDGNRKLAP